MCNSKKLKFLKKHEAKLGNLLGTKIPTLGDTLLVNTLF